MGAISAALLAAVMTQQSPTEVRITISNYGARVPVVVEQLAAASGLTLEADEEMDRDIVAIYAKDQPLDEVMDRLAESVQGRWAKRGSTRILRPDAGVRRRDEQERITRHGQRVAAAVETTRRVFAGRKNSSKSGSILAALTELLASNGSPEIVRLGRNRRLVFSTHPTKMQLRLHGSTGPAMRLMVESHNDRAGDEQPDFDDGFPDEMMTGELRALLEKHRPQPMKKIETQPAKLNMVVSFDGYDLYDRVRSLPATVFMLFDSHGNLLTSKRIRIYDPPDQESTSEQSRRQTGEESEPSAAKHQIKLSKESLLVLSDGDLEADLPAADQELRRKLMTRVHDFEPLQFGLGESLVKSTQALNTSGVFYLADEDLHEGGRTTAEDTLFRLSLEEDVTEEDGWIVSVPPNHITTRAVRLDRESLQTLLIARDRQGFLTLDQRADFAFANPLGSQGMAFSLLGIQDFAIGEELGGGDWTMLRFLGSLPKHQREIMRSGGRLGFSSLSQASRAIVEEMVFGTESNLLPGLGSAKSARPTMIDLMLGEVMDFSDGTSTGFIEPTNVLGSGLPRGGFVQIDAYQEPAFLPTLGDREVKEVGALSLDLMAFYEEMTEAIRGTPEAAGFPSLGKVKVGERLSMRAVFQVSPSVHLVRDLYDDSFESDEEFLRSQLPASASAKLKERRDFYRPYRSFLRMLGGMAEGESDDPPSD